MRKIWNPSQDLEILSCLKNMRFTRRSLSARWLKPLKEKNNSYLKKPYGDKAFDEETSE